MKRLLLIGLLSVSSAQAGWMEDEIERNNLEQDRKRERIQDQHDQLHRDIPDTVYRVRRGKIIGPDGTVCSIDYRKRLVCSKP